MTTYLSDRQDTNLVLSTERKIDIPPEIYWLSTDIAPLVHISKGSIDNKSKAKSRACINPEFTVLEKENKARFTAVNYSTGYTAGASTITLDSVTHINVGDLLKNVVKEEIVRVTAKSNDAGTVTVTRAFGATAAATTWADNEPVLRLINASEENGAIPNILMVQNRKRTNYCGIFRKTFGMSGTAENSEYYGGKKRPELAKEAYLEVMRDEEYGFIWGEPFEDMDGGANGHPIRMTGGLWYWGEASGTVTTATTTFTKAGWMTFVRRAFEYGDATTRVALCSPLIIEMLDYWKDSKLQMRPSDDLYRVNVAEWETGNGRLLIVRDTILANSPAGTTTAGYGGVCIVFDPALIQHRHLQNREMALYKDRVKDGTDGWTDEYLGEEGLQVVNPENISILEDVTTYA